MFMTFRSVVIWKIWVGSSKMSPTWKVISPSDIIPELESSQIHRHRLHVIILVPEINPTFPGMTTFQPKISACARVRSLEKKFRAAKPNLIMAKKNNFDWANLEPNQKINHFRYIRTMFPTSRCNKIKTG